MGSSESGPAPSYGSRPPRPLDTLSVVALVLAATIVLAVPALVLGLIGLARTGPHRRGRPVATAAVIVSGLTFLAGGAIGGVFAGRAATMALAESSAGASVVAGPADAAAGATPDEWTVPPSAVTPDGPQPSAPGPSPTAAPPQAAVLFDRPGTVEIEPTPVPFDAILVGQCLMELPGSLLVDELVVSDCDSPHVYEFLGDEVIDAAGATPWPGDEAVQNLAYDVCRAGLTERGADRGMATDWLDLAFLYPSQEGWAAADGSVTCLVYDVSGADLVGETGLNERALLPLAITDATADGDL